MLLAAVFVEACADASAPPVERSGTGGRSGPSGWPSKRLIAGHLGGKTAQQSWRHVGASFVEQHAGGDGGVQAFDRAGAGNCDCSARPGGKFVWEAVAFVADEERDWFSQVDLIGGLGFVHRRRKNFDARRRADGETLGGIDGEDAACGRRCRRRRARLWDSTR